MGCLLVLAVLALPVAEVALALHLADRLGWPAAIAVGAGTMLAGVSLARSGRLAAARRMAGAQDPARLARAAFDAACCSAAEFLFLFPGVVSDALGALLLLQPVRDILAARLAGRVQAGGSRGFRVVWRAGPMPGRRGPAAGPKGQPPPRHTGEVIDIEAEDVTPGSRPELPPGDQDRKQED